MNHTRTNRIVAFIVFLVTVLTYIRTLPPTVVFWDVGEHCAASYLVQVQHPPGSPLLVLVMRVASMLPIVSDIAVRMILVNMLASSIVVMLLYLITVRCILLWRPVPSTAFDALSVYGSAALGALALTFSTTFWFNSIEVETRNMSLLFTALIIWLVLLWRERAEEKYSDLYLLLITFLVGLTTGIHIHGLLGFIVAILVVYFRSYQKSLREFLFTKDLWKFGAVATAIFCTAYPGTVKWLPRMMNSEIFGSHSVLWLVLATGILAGAVYAVWYSYKKKNRILHLASLSFLFILLGYSTYLTSYIRAGVNPPINENDPSTLPRFITYLEREQYGETPLVDRRFSLEPDKQANFKKYTSDLDYLWEYQIKHMYLRYLGWNFIGKEADWQDAGVRFSQLYGIPFLVGLFGLYYHWKKDQKMAFIMSVFFLLTGLALAVYFNMQEAQPRERDYFFVYSIFSFCFWIGIGVLALLDLIRERIEGANVRWIGYGAFALVFLLVPGNMFRTNVKPMSRNGHYLAWDYSYNILQSTEKDAVLITAGDNDTFPLWYLQDVEGVRRDVRVVCLSLANTDWYIKQLKHGRPFGSKPVPMGLPDDQIEGIQPFRWQTQMVQIPIPRFAKEGRSESPDSASRAIVDTMKFVMPATVHYGNVSGLRVQDVVVFDIVRSSNWERPVYYSVTCGGEINAIGLKDYLELQGLAYKVVPQRRQAYYPPVNEEKTRKHLFTDVKEPSREPAYGCLWRGLRDSTVHFDENQRNMIRSYSIPFTSLASYMVSAANRSQEVSAVFDRMEQVVPRRLHPIDYRSKSDIAYFYGVAGNTERYKEYLGEIVQEVRPIVDAGSTEPLSQYNPFVLLVQAYEGLGEYDNASEILQRVERLYAKTSGAKEFVASKRMEVEAMRKSQSARADTNSSKIATKK